MTLVISSSLVPPNSDGGYGTGLAGSRDARSVILAETLSPVHVSASGHVSTSWSSSRIAQVWRRVVQSVGAALLCAGLARFGRHSEAAWGSQEDIPGPRARFTLGTIHPFGRCAVHAAGIS